MSEIRLIDANALIADYRVCGADCKDYENCSGYVVMCDCARFRQAINDQPTVEVPTVHYGHWENPITGLTSVVFCTECGAAADRILASKYKGCPFCLCVMRQ